MDYENMADEELEAVIENAQLALRGRRREAELELELRQVMGDARASGVAMRPTQGNAWQRPSGAHNAYMGGDVVTHEGKRWVSTVSPNTWEPGVSGWHHQPEDDPETGEPGVPEWVRPSGAHDAYEQGDRVLYDGEVYESVHPTANTWSPHEYPPAWKLIEGETQ